MRLDSRSLVTLMRAVELFPNISERSVPPVRLVAIRSKGVPYLLCPPPLSGRPRRPATGVPAGVYVVTEGRADMAAAIEETAAPPAPPPLPSPPPPPLLLPDRSPTAAAWRSVAVTVAVHGCPAFTERTVTGVGSTDGGQPPRWQVHAWPQGLAMGVHSCVTSTPSVASSASLPPTPTLSHRWCSFMAKSGRWCRHPKNALVRVWHAVIQQCTNGGRSPGSH